MDMDEIINKLKSTALSPEQLKKFYREVTGKDLKVLFLNEIAENDTVESLFSTGCFVLFVPIHSENNGHFVSMWRNRNGIYWLDSYANTPKQLLNIIDRIGKVTPNKNLFRIIRESGEAVYSNTVLYQTKTETVSDCGRFAVTACIWATTAIENNKLFTLVDFNDLMVKFMRESNIMDYDDAIVEITIGLV